MKLILFGGGSICGDKSFPKPLKFINTSKRMIEAYIHHLSDRFEKIDEIIILCDDDQHNQYENIFAKNDIKYNCTILTCGNNSTTFEKFVSFINSERCCGNLLFTYPDIFVFEIENSVHKYVLKNESIGMTIHPVVSRFPQVFVNFFSDEVSSVSSLSSKYPANVSYIFAGELFGQAEQFHRYLSEFLHFKNQGRTELETDFLHFLGNRNVLKYILSSGERLWIDSDRDISNLNKYIDG